MNSQFDLGRSLMIIGLVLLGLGFLVSVLGRLDWAAFPATSGWKDRGSLCTSRWQAAYS
jgi:hypothetical protein